FEGMVTAVVGSGIFVAIADPFVDVLVRMDALGPDAYEIDEEGLRVIGVRSGERIALGDRMLVVVEDVSVIRRTVYARRLIDAQTRRPRRGKKPEKEPRRRVKAEPKRKKTREAKGTATRARKKGGRRR